MAARPRFRASRTGRNTAAPTIEGSTRPERNHDAPAAVMPLFVPPTMLAATTAPNPVTNHG
jgi:hypothetical protein